MAEALAIIGLVSAIVQFVDFGNKVVERLNEFSSDLNELPRAFRAIKIQLPLLSDTLNRTQHQANAGHVSEATAEALKPLVEACLNEVKVLKTILDKTIPPQNSSGWRRRLLALKSLAHDKDVDLSISKLESHMRVLSFHQSATSSDELFQLRALLQPPEAILHEPHKPIFMVPFDRDETFVGRQSILDNIDKSLNASRRRAVLSGIGGVGKSQIAIQYCYQYRSEHSDRHVFWVHCGSIARFDQGYREIARMLKLPGFNDPEINAVKTVFDWLSDDDNGGWLLVLDNADNQEIFFGSSGRSTSQDILQQQLGALARYLPRSAYGSTLVTTRDQRVGERFAERDKAITLLPLDAEEAKSMLFARLPDHPNDTAEAEILELVESLQCLPLAIAQAASYISEEGVTVARYLELLRPGNADSKLLLEQEYYDWRRHEDIHNSVFQTWKISFNQIRQQMPRAAEMLSLICVLDKQSIPRKLLQDDEEEGESQVIFDRALATLKNFSLIREEKSKQTYEIHRLVQLSTQWWLEQDKTLTKWQERALGILLRHCPSSTNAEDWKAWESISPHITTVQGYHFERGEQKLQYADITSQMGGYNRALGRYAVALKLEEIALAIRQELLGKEHPDTLMSMSNLALVLSDQGKYEHAEEMNRQTLQLREAVLGKEHPSTLTSMNNLALVLSDQGKYEQAEEMHRQELKVCEIVLGGEHPSTLTSMNNLALVLSDQGKYEQAEEIHRQTLQLREVVLGREHPSTLTSMNNLALVLNGQGKYKQAEEIHRQTLQLREVVLGKEHPSTLTSMNNLALALSNQGNYRQAEDMHREELKVCEIVLGREHPSTLTSMNNLASVLNSQGKYKQAEEIHRQALQLREVVLGREHPSTLTSMNNLALVLNDQGKYKQAEEIHRQTLQLREVVLGKEHPSTLTSMNNLALALSNQGNYRQAEEMHRQELELCTTALGKEHPDTLTSVENLVDILVKQGKHEQAEEMYRQYSG